VHSHIARPQLGRTEALIEGPYEVYIGLKCSYPVGAKPHIESRCGIRVMNQHPQAVHVSESGEQMNVVGMSAVLSAVKWS